MYSRDVTRETWQTRQPIPDDTPPPLFTFSVQSFCYFCVVILAYNRGDIENQDLTKALRLTAGQRIRLCHRHSRLRATSYQTIYQDYRFQTDKTNIVNRRMTLFYVVFFFCTSIKKQHNCVYSNDLNTCNCRPRFI